MANKQLDRMGNASAMEREENEWKLERAIERGDVRTVKSAMDLLCMSRATILKYLKSLDISIINDATMKMTKGSKVYHIDS